MSEDSRLALRNSGQLLARILDEPNLVAAVQSLPAQSLGKVISHVGLEDAGELVALATTAQLRSIFDDDLWRSPSPGKDETFDADRFTLWLEVMLEAGEEFTAAKLAELPEDLVTLAFHKQVLVINIEELAIGMSSRASEHSADEDTQLEKALESCLADELGEYRIIARRHESWDTLFGLLVALDRDHHEFLERLLERLCALDAAFIEDNGGLYQVLTAEESLEADVGADREDRRAEHGYIAPSSATAFLALARTTKLADILSADAQDPITQSYFRQLGSHARGSTTDDAAAKKKTAPPSDVAAASSLLDLLHEAEVLPSVPSTRLLEGPASAKSDDSSTFTAALRKLADDAAGVHATRMREMGYLANVLCAGCSVAGRAMRPIEAAPAVVAVCNLGLEHVLATKKERTPLQGLRNTSADKLFKIGWNLLFHEVVLAAATGAQHMVVQAIEHAPDGSKALERAAAALRSAVAAGKPWIALRSLQPLQEHLGQATWASLSALLDECPALVGGESAEGTFIATQKQIASAQAFIAKLGRER
jgi:hypothetical protein